MRGWFRRSRRALSVKPSTRRPAPCRLSLEPLEERALLASGFLQTNLVSNMPGLAAVTDPQLVNPWGISAGPFWVLGQPDRLLHDLQPATGVKAGLIVTIPSAPGSPFKHATPTGMVINTDPDGSGFQRDQRDEDRPGIFLFDTLDGTIDGWIGRARPTPSSASYPKRGRSTPAWRSTPPPTPRRPAATPCCTPPTGAPARSRCTTAASSRSKGRLQGRGGPQGLPPLQRAGHQRQRLGHLRPVRPDDGRRHRHGRVRGRVQPRRRAGDEL